MIYRELTDRIIDASGSKPTADRQTAKNIANEAYFDIIVAARLNQTSITLPLVADQWEYSFVDDFALDSIAGIRGISLGGRLYDQSSSLDIMRLRGLGAGAADRIYALRGLSTILIYPTPTLGDELLLEYTAAPDVMSDDEEGPTDIPEPFHDTVWMLGSYYACMRSREDRFWARAPFYEQQYTKRLGQLRAHIDSWGSPLPMVMPRPFRVQARLAPDQDPVSP